MNDDMDEIVTNDWKLICDVSKRSAWIDGSGR